MCYVLAQFLMISMAALAWVYVTVFNSFFNPAGERLIITTERDAALMRCDACLHAAWLQSLAGFNTCMLTAVGASIRYPTAHNIASWSSDCLPC